jgi:hypothetical protein
MNEEERAEWLARAIDDLLNKDRQRPKEPPPPKFDREELNALLRIASARAEAANSRLHSGLQYEGEVWQRVLKRLDRRQFPRQVRSFDAPGPVSELDEFEAGRELEQMEIDELREIARMRREMAERAASLGEEHRAEVWQRVQGRLEGKGRTRFRFRRRKDDHDRLAAALQRTAAGEDSGESGDEEFDALVDVARYRTYWSQLMQDTAAERQDRLWVRISAAIRARLLSSAPKEAGPWRKLAIASVIGAVAVAALAPLPATGFADHPVARAVRSIAEHVGVRETAAPPRVSGAPLVVEGTALTPAEVSSFRLGVPVLEPSLPPAGFELASAKFFKEALTAYSGGVFVLTYAREGGSAVVVYQERADGADFSAGSGSAEDVKLADGTAATFVQGTWQEAGGELVWAEGGAQTLVFERDGARTTIQYRGPPEEAPSLFTMANSMTPVTR